MIASLLAFEYWWVFSSVASSRPVLRLMITSASQNVFLDKPLESRGCSEGILTPLGKTQYFSSSLKKKKTSHT